MAQILNETATTITLLLDDAEITTLARAQKRYGVDALAQIVTTQLQVLAKNFNTEAINEKIREARMGAGRFPMRLE